MDTPQKTILKKASGKRTNTCRAKQLDDRRGREERLRIDVINQRASHEEIVRRSQQVGTEPKPEPTPEPAALTPEPAPAVSDQSASINHFLRTAQRGRSKAASSGERTAHRLAAALHQIGDDIALLDSVTLTGFLNLARAAAGPWRTDDAKHQIYQAIEAAGKRP